MKAKKRSRSSNASSWSGADHAERNEHLRAQKTQRQVERTARLSHDTFEKRQGMRLKMHLTKTQREVDQLKERLQSWDAQEEAEKERQAKRKAEEEKQPPQKKKRGRKGPETWKLKGAARPAWEVYDFDTRYVDPHIQAHQQAQAKARRCQNLLIVYQGRLGEPEAPSVGREYLGLLMQLGHLAVEAKQYKTARAAWLECIDLEGNNNPVTTARELLMQLYLQLERWGVAWRLGERLSDDPSLGICYSMALVAFVQEKDDVETYMVRAIRANPFCAYYLAFYETFNGVMEYTQDLEDSEEEPQSSLEEAIEYCCSEQAKLWLDSKANLTLKSIVVRAVQGHHSRLTLADVEWKRRLDRIEESSPVAPSESKDEGDPKVDVHMFIGMFRTAMEMLEETGQVPTDHNLPATVQTKDEVDNAVNSRSKSSR